MKKTARRKALRPQRAKGTQRAKGEGQRAARRRPASTDVQAVTTKELRALKKKIEKQAALRWNPDSADVQRSVIKLVLTLVELIRKLMERQAIRRMEAKTLDPEQTEAVGTALMEIERTIRDIGKMFDLTPEDLNLDLGALKLM
jgi:gas vesicle protein GvpK